MSQITRYVLRQLAAGMLFVSVALTAILWLTQSLRFIELIVNKGLSVLTFLELTLLLMPGFLVVILPVSLFAVVLFTYNRLITDRELVVMRAAGLSHFAIARPALLLGLVMTLVGYLLSCWLIPLTMREFREMQWSIRNDIGTILLQEGTFNKFGDGLTIYVRSRTPDGELTGILVHDQRNPQRPVTIMAERGALVMTPTGPRVLMVNGNRQEVPVGTGQFSLLQFDSYTVDFQMAKTITTDRFRDARERGLDELLMADADDLSPREYRRFRVELHNRLTSPLYALGFALTACAILLTWGFDRRGQLRSVLTAIAALVGIQAAALGASNLATGSLAFVPAIYLAAFGPIIAGGWPLLRPPQTRRPHRSSLAPALPSR